MNRTTRHKIFLLSVCLFILIAENKAQTLETNCLHYPYNTQIGINLNANISSKMRIEPLSNHLLLHPSFTFNIGVYLYQRIYKWFGIQIGAEYNATTMYYTENLEDNSKWTKMEYYATGGFNFPVLFNASYYFNEKHGMDISLGGAPLILLPSGGYGSTSHTGEKIYRFNIRHENPFNFSLYGKIGYNFMFKNKNTVGVAIVGSYAKTPYAQGKYFVKENGIIIETGSTSLRNTFIGLQFSYGFTMKKLLCIPRTA
jgi:hypothetical protein